jgi:hypothetical protein
MTKGATMRKQSTPPADTSKDTSSELLDATLPELTDEEIACEMIELTCDEMDSLSRAFTMISELCTELSEEVEQELAEETSKIRIH